MSDKAANPYTRLFQPNIPLSDNTELRFDLTPPDLVAAGYIVRPHRFAGFWCWWRALNGGGQSFGEPRFDLEAVYASARWRKQSDDAPPTFEGINSTELERWTNGH